MKVHEIMTGNPGSIGPENTLVEAAGLMRELDVGALPVMDNETLTGIVTDRDLVIRGIADGQDPSRATVRDVMSGGTERVFADQEVEEAVRVMEQRQIRRLPVMDRGEKLVGMVSLGDIATSSNPAFSGMALRDVSEPNNPSARRRRLAQASEPARMPAVPGERRGPSGGQGRTRTQAQARVRGSSSRAQQTRKSSGKTKARAGSGRSSATRTRGRKGKKAMARSRR